jgi:hypothetical protein
MEPILTKDQESYLSDRIDGLICVNSLSAFVKLQLDIQKKRVINDLFMIRVVNSHGKRNPVEIGYSQAVNLIGQDVFDSMIILALISRKRIERFKLAEKSIYIHKR